jgi:hypothetical protein
VQTNYATGGKNGAAGTTGASVDASGNPIVPFGTYNMVTNDAFHIGLDPSVQKYLALAPLPNTFTVGDGFNTAGYNFAAPATDKQVDTTYKIDDTFSSRHSIFGRWYLSLNNVAGLANSLATRLQSGTPLVVVSGLPATFFKPYSQYLGGLNVLQTRDYSNYNGLQLQIEKRFSKGFLFQANYVYSKTLDVRSFDPTFTTVGTGGTQSAAATPFDYHTPRLNYAPADFDNTHTVAGNWVYDLSFGRGRWLGRNMNRAVDTLIGGWQIAGDGNWYSGRPITFFSGSNTFSGSVQTRPPAPVATRRWVISSSIPAPES